VHIDVTTDTAAGAAAAINARSIGVRAGVVNTDSGPLLQLTATSTGTAAAFTVDGSVAAPNIVTAAADAQIAVGDPANGGYTMSSGTNTFTGVLPGTTVTVAAVQAGVTVSVVRDTGQIADKIQSLVDATNAALAEIGNQTAYDASSKTAKPLAGNFAVQQLQQRLLSAVSNGDTGYGSFAQLGVSLDKSGQLSFDRSAFLTAYAADPDTVQATVTRSIPDPDHPGKTKLTGLAGTLGTVATSATDTTTGSLTLAIQSRNDAVRSLNNEIDDWDVRLKTRQQDLQRQYASLEVALGKLKDQSSWLSGQIATLPSA
jgi:flagellar hook-associated protein 2